MILENLLGENNRLKVLEELLSNHENYLTIDELARMSGLSKDEVTFEIDILLQINFLDYLYGQNKVQYKLKNRDLRVNILQCLWYEEYFRRK